jgi:CBS domain-containing protein
MPTVKDLMTKNVITVDLSTTVFDAAVIMTEKRKGCLIVTEGDAPVGIVTERDIVRRFVYRSLVNRETKVSEIMSKPLITIEPDSSIRDAARLMIKNNIRRLPVVKENKLVGILTTADFAKQLSKKTITEEILDAMARYPLNAPEYKERAAYMESHYKVEK